MTNIEKIRQEIERRMEELERDKYINIDAKACRHSELKFLERFIDSLPEETCKESLQVHETCKENTDSFTSDLDENNRKTRDAEVILNGHGLLVDVTKWADGYKLKVIVKEE